MLKLCVVGKDVSASQSPRMHGFILHELGAECIYDNISLPREKFEARMKELFSEYDAVNVTIPYKADVIPLIKELAGDAPAFGAVNTVLCKSLAGYNTDGYGFLLMLKNAGVEIAGKSVLVLGAGGAGRSCIKKLLDGGAKPFVYERDGARLHAVCDEFAGAVPLDKVPYRPFDILLNCTGIGMHATVGQTPAVRFEDGERPADNRLLSLCETAVDLIYEPAQSEFLRIADSLGKKTVNGGSMLFYQAYAADCIYLQREPSAEEAEGLWKKYQEKTK